MLQKLVAALTAFALTSLLTALVPVSSKKTVCDFRGVTGSSQSDEVPDAVPIFAAHATGACKLLG